MQRRNFLTSLCLFGSSLMLGCVSDGGDALFQKPSVYLVSLTPKKVNQSELAFDLGLLIKNPNMLPLPINNISSQLALNGINFLSASGTAKKAIPANSSGKMTLSTTVSLDKVKRLARTFRSNEIQYDLTGDVGVGALGQNMNVPFRQNGKVNATQLVKKLIKASMRN